MQLILPEILADARGMSVAVYITGLVLGLLLWMLGWWGHRFWIVLFTTVIAGIVGLSSGRAAGVQPFVAGLLLAITAGVMALALARMLAFVAGGVAGFLLLHSVAPAWEEPLLSFLVGGLLGLLLFRLWTMALTSFGGALLMTYSSLGLADRLGKLNALDWAEKRFLLLNGIVISLTLIGWVMQFLLERLRVYREKQRKEMEQLEQAEREIDQRLRRRSRWWPWGDNRGARRAA
jgi:MFS family permease